MFTYICARYYNLYYYILLLPPLQLTSLLWISVNFRILCKTALGSVPAKYENQMYHVRLNSSC